ncbi:MAG: beta/gamma crystallin-related protein [Pseudomonadota bacterium]
MLKWIARTAAMAFTTLVFIAAPASADRNEDWRRDRAEILVEEYLGTRLRTGGALILFKDPGFRGQGYAINGQISNLRRVGFNDTASSLRIRRGNWLVCTDPDFRGHCQVFTSDQGAFSRRGLNDRISSVRPISEREARRFARGGVFDRDFSFGHNRSQDRFGGTDRGFAILGRDGGAALIVYKDPNGRGSALPINQSISYLRSTGFNDTISSIEVRDGRWEICSDPDFRGRCRVIDRSIGYTRDIGLNDNISSIRRLDSRRRRY